jgi:hypothetical protein
MRIHAAVFSKQDPVFSSAKRHFFRRPPGPTKIRPYFRRPNWPTKIPLFSSAANEKAPIFVDFISSACFRRLADKNSYFRRHLPADENILFSCSGKTWLHAERISWKFHCYKASLLPSTGLVDSWNKQSSILVCGKPSWQSYTYRHISKFRKVQSTDK